MTGFGGVSSKVQLYISEPMFSTPYLSINLFPKISIAQGTKAFAAPLPDTSLLEKSNVQYS